MTATPPRDGAGLCLSCGICCRGVIFQIVRLRDDEVALARRLRLPVVESRGRAAFTQPCPRHEDGACAVYEERPDACRSFVCHTLAAYLAGEIDIAAATARVDRLRATAARVRDGLPAELRDRELWEAVAALSDEGERSPDRSAWRRQHAGLLLDVIELEALCRRDFTTRPKSYDEV